MIHLHMVHINNHLTIKNGKATATTTTTTMRTTVLVGRGGSSALGTGWVLGALPAEGGGTRGVEVTVGGDLE